MDPVLNFQEFWAIKYLFSDIYRKKFRSKIFHVYK